MYGSGVRARHLGWVLWAFVSADWLIVTPGIRPYARCHLPPLNAPLPHAVRYHTPDEQNTMELRERLTPTRRRYRITPEELDAKKDAGYVICTSNGSRDGGHSLIDGSSPAFYENTDMPMARRTHTLASA
eukprot:COSAG02_NODE_3846_length_6153_cov_1.953089_1_plen_130_part_00